MRLSPPRTAPPTRAIRNSPDSCIKRNIVAPGPSALVEWDETTPSVVSGTLIVRLYARFGSRTVLQQMQFRSGAAEVRAVRPTAEALRRPDQHFAWTQRGCAVRAVRGPRLDPAARGLTQPGGRLILLATHHATMLIERMFDGHGCVRVGGKWDPPRRPLSLCRRQPQEHRPSRTTNTCASAQPTLVGVMSDRYHRRRACDRNAKTPA